MSRVLTEWNHYEFRGDRFIAVLKRHRLIPKNRPDFIVVSFLRVQFYLFPRGGIFYERMGSEINRSSSFMVALG